jgi:hypothetical protein
MNLSALAEPGLGRAVSGLAEANIALTRCGHFGPSDALEDIIVAAKHHDLTENSARVYTARPPRRACQASYGLSGAVLWFCRPELPRGSPLRPCRTPVDLTALMFATSRSRRKNRFLQLSAGSVRADL